jgi:hypothetical protein
MRAPQLEGNDAIAREAAKCRVDRLRMPSAYASRHQALNRGSCVLYDECACRVQKAARRDTRNVWRDFEAQL